MSDELEMLRFLNAKDVSHIAQAFGTPTYVYDQASYEQKIAEVESMPNAFGLKVYLAMKACGGNPLILKIFKEAGVGIDASSIYEVRQALNAGFGPEQIAITTQQVYGDEEWETLLEVCVNGGVFHASSLRQLEEYGKRRPGTSVGVRLNPGIGSGHSAKTNVGGVTSSFGIWYELTGEVKKITKRHGLVINRLHTQIGSGADPAVWIKAAKITLGLAKQFPEVGTVDLGGGFKVARMDYEVATDLQAVGGEVKAIFENFADETGRQLKLNIEPGNFLTANAGCIVSEVIDIKSTGKSGYEFLVVNSGMTENLRPILYGSQHPLIVVGKKSTDSKKDYVVVGHNCESGDILTPKPGEPDVVAERMLQAAAIGDMIVMEGTGAYCASMSARGYNSFPTAKEILRRKDGTFVDISFRA